MADQPGATAGPPGRDLWLRWALLSAVSAAALPFVSAALRIGGVDTNDSGTGWMVHMALAFAVVGLADWLVLRRYLRTAYVWVPATVAGGCCGLGIAGGVLALGLVGAVWYLGADPQALWRSPLILMAVGLAFVVLTVAGMAMAQALVLRQAARRAWLWVPYATGPAILQLAVVFLLAGGPVIADDAGAVARDPILDLLWGGAYGATYGALTGYGLVRLLRDPPRPESARSGSGAQVQVADGEPFAQGDTEFEAKVQIARRILLVALAAVMALLAYRLWQLDQ